METLALSETEEVFAVNGRKHLSNTSCDRSSFSRSTIDSGRGAELGKKRRRSSCVSDTNTITGSWDELDGERRREKAGSGSGLTHS